MYEELISIYPACTQSKYEEPISV